MNVAGQIMARNGHAKFFSYSDTKKGRIAAALIKKLIFKVRINQRWIDSLLLGSLRLRSH